MFNVVIHKIFKKLILSFSCLSVLIAHAQDLHFSQYNSSPLNLNPAHTGLFDGNWRVMGNYRTQWSAIPVPYNSYSIGADTRLKTKLQNDVPGVGIVINTDKAGDSRFTTTQILVSGNYIKKLSADSVHFVSIGIQPGFTTRNFNTNNLTFDNQFDGDHYNAAAASGENFTQTRISYFDLGAGINYLFRLDNRTRFMIGWAGFHLNKPKQSFFDNKEIKLDVKHSISCTAQFAVATHLDVIPSALIQQQGKYNETLIGLFGKYYLKPIDGTTTALYLGAFQRLKDAFILKAAMDYRNFNVGISYDVTTSKLRAANNSRGALEFSVIYIFKKIPPFVAKKRVCPIYM
jgi:type IX secretion system PorP/SprF family membrane protein